MTTIQSLAPRFAGQFRINADYYRGAKIDDRINQDWHGFGTKLSELGVTVTKYPQPGKKFEYAIIDVPDQHDRAVWDMLWEPNGGFLSNPKFIQYHESHDPQDEFRRANHVF